MTEVIASARPRPTLAHLGLHRLTHLLVVLNAGLAVATVPFYGTFGLTIDWSTFVIPMLAVGFAAAGWVGHMLAPGRPGEWPIAESLIVFILIALCCMVVTPAQYLAVALDRPLADPWLARADAFLGLSVPEAVAWTRDRPWLTWVLGASYGSLQAQFAAPILILGMYWRDRQALWEYAFHFHLCLALTLLGLALFPAMCAFSYYGFESLIDQTVFIRDFNALRSGTFTVLRLTELEGLITFPSFHVAGGLFVTWVFRRYPVMFGCLVVLNVLMVASTVLLGPHYAVDVLASLLMVAASIVVYDRWGRALINPAPAGPTAAGDPGRSARTPMPRPMWGRS